MVTSVKYRRQ